MYMGDLKKKNKTTGKSNHWGKSTGMVESLGCTPDTSTDIIS